MIFIRHYASPHDIITLTILLPPPTLPSLDTDDYIDMLPRLVITGHFFRWWYAADVAAALIAAADTPLPLSRAIRCCLRCLFFSITISFDISLWCRHFAISFSFFAACHYFSAVIISRHFLSFDTPRLYADGATSLHFRWYEVGAIILPLRFSLSLSPISLYAILMPYVAARETSP